MRRNEVNMLSGSIVKALFTISLPIMIMNIINSLFNIIDMTILKSFSPEDSFVVGAVGICGTPTSLIINFAIGLSIGANAVIARYIGANDHERTEKAVGATVFFSLVCGFAMLVLGVLLSKDILVLVGCADELLADATLYFRLYFLGIPLFILYTFLTAIFRSVGDTRRPMLYIITGGAAKIMLTYVFVGIFNMSIIGVALSTIISWLITAALLLITLIRSDFAVKLYLSRIRFYPKEILNIIKIGLPAALQNACYSIANVSVAAEANSFGAAATTGVSIANNYDSVLYNITYSPSLAVLPFMSQNIGAGNVKRAKKAVWRGILIATSLGLFFGSLSAIFSGQLSSIMSSNPDVIRFSQQKMILISPLYLLNGISQIFCEGLRVMKKPVVPTISSFLFYFALRLVYIYLVFPMLREYNNLSLLYLAWPISWISAIIFLLSFYLPTAKKFKLPEQDTAVQEA